MFDNPNEELKRLENELLQAEMTDEEFEHFYDEIYEEFGPADRDEDLTADIPSRSVRNYANGYGTGSRPHTQSGPAPRTADRNVTYADPDAFRIPEASSKSVRGLVITACLECVGIVGIIAWWLVRYL